MKTSPHLKYVFLTAFALFILSSIAHALPTPGDKVLLKDAGIGNTSGGEFEVYINGSTTSNYFSFCVEKTQYISLNRTYRISSVSDDVYGGGIDRDVDTYGYDTLSGETQWVVYTYFFGSFTNGATTVSRGSSDLANDIQNIIWYLEDEQSWDTLSQDTQDFYNSYILGQTSNIYNDYVTALNITNYWRTADKQSQIIAEQAPVPEPETMLLFGTGLIGLASIARRRTNR